MKYNLQVTLDGNTIVGCMHFSQANNPVEAVRQTLDAFIAAMQDKNRLPIFEPEQIEKVLSQYDFEMPSSDDMFEDIRGYLPKEQPAEDFSKVGEQAEKLINTAAEPHVKRSVHLDDSVDSSDEINQAEDWKINLFISERLDITVLKKLAPLDRFIQQAESAVATSAPNWKVLVAAVETCYTSLPRSSWGSDYAQQQIEQLIERHSEEV
jgi:hypothetical protein